jgi:hypothetical protein
MSWRLVSKPIEPSDSKCNWTYAPLGRWEPLHNRSSSKLFATKGEAMFALQQVKEDDEDQYTYSVEEVP